MNKKKLVFDIEMVGEDFDAMDALTQQDLMKSLPDPKVDQKKYDSEFEELKRKLVFSPLTGKVIAIGVYNPDDGKGAVYYDAGETKPEDTEIDNIKYVAMTEPEMLTKFWALAEVHDEFIDRKSVV